MSWIKVSSLVPPEDEQVLIHDNKSSRIELGRYKRGKWYIENLQTGETLEVAGITHWCWILESQINDDGDDD